MRQAGAHRGHRRRQAAGRRHVVVLDHGAVEQPEAVRAAAAVDDGLLFEGAQPGRGLARAGDDGRGAGRLGHVARRDRGHAGQTGQEVEAGALEGEDARLAAGERGQRGAARQSGAPDAQANVDDELGVDQAGGFGEGGDARQDAVGARLDPRPSGRGEGATREVAEAGEVFGERAPGRVVGGRAQRRVGQAGVHGRRSATRGRGQSQGDVALPVVVVALGVVVAHVHAAGLFAQQRALGDLRGQREDVEQLELGRPGLAQAQRRVDGAQLLEGVEQAVFGAHPAYLFGHEPGHLAAHRGDVAARRRVPGGRGQLELQPAHVFAEAADVAVEVAHHAVAEDEALEQRVRGKAVGAVHARAGDLAGRVEAGHRGAPPDVGHHAADGVVRHGGDRYEVAAQVEIVLGEQAGDARKAARAACRRRGAVASR